MGLKHGYACSCGFGEEYEYTLNGAGTCETECIGGGSSICGKPLSNLSWWENDDPL